MGDTDLSKFDLSQLQAELEEEREVKEMLEESVSDLKGTIVDLEERLLSVDGEGNEWKTRYETQLELNAQLERQIRILHERLDGLRGDPTDRLASIRSYDDMPVDALRQRLKVLTSERSSLQSQLLDCRLRIEQEGKMLRELCVELISLPGEEKAYQKAYDERRAYLSEIAKVSSILDLSRKVQLGHPRGATQSPHEKGHVGNVKRGGDVKRGRERGGARVNRLPKLKR